MAGSEVRFTDNSADVLQDIEGKKAKALEIIGLVVEGYAKRMCTVDTGRLRNSITHATQSNTGQDTYSDNDGKQFGGGSAHTAPTEDMVCIGTNVEYAPYVEMGTVRTPAQPFLKPAAADHVAQYKDIILRVLEGSL